MEPFLSTFTAILLVELTDRTRLIALLLSARYKSPLQLITGMTLGYVVPVAIAVLGADVITRIIPPEVLRWVVAVAFIGFGLALLRTEHHEDGSPAWAERFEKMGPFIMGFILVMVTEFGDKSQVATAGLMMKYQRALPVFLGSMAAQGALNVIYVGLGRFIGERLPVDKIRWVAAILFILAGIAALAGWKI